jgi:glycosyltransferase involved in cell wall biosynthesis
MLYADQRWIGNHGIGRFARHVLGTLEYIPVQLRSNPAAPLDSWRLTRALADLNGDDIFFSPGYNTPLFCRSPFVFTIHDLSHVYCPENSSTAIRLYYATVLKRACRYATKIFTVSEFTRKQIIAWADVQEEKVFNVGCGVDAAYHPGHETYGLPFPYLLCVSNRKEHKNEFRLVEAFAKAAIADSIRLVFTGRPETNLVHRIDRYRLAERIVFLGGVPEAKLPSVYRGAKALVFPSLYEGFGLPVLEAMACGTLVVTSNVTAMPETAGDAALLVDPRSVEEIAQAIERIVEDEALRQQLRERGLEQAATFSWARTCSQVQQVLATLSDRQGEVIERPQRTA